MLDFREFPFMGKSLRVIMYNDTPYFVAADACELLGVKSYEASHRICRGKFPVSEYMKVSELITLDEDYIKHGIWHQSPSGLLFGKISHKAFIVNEAGLYRLIMRSDKPQARKFQDWVFGEVLPSIRKTGKYSVSPDEATSTVNANVLSRADVKPEEMQITLPLNKLGDKLIRIHALIGELITELNTL